eukprot:1147457-Pelagomonas_calceolata.AAC.2
MSAVTLDVLLHEANHYCPPSTSDTRLLTGRPSISFTSGKGGKNSGNVFDPPWEARFTVLIVSTLCLMHTKAGSVALFALVSHAFSNFSTGSGHRQRYLISNLDPPPTLLITARLSAPSLDSASTTTAGCGGTCLPATL